MTKSKIFFILFLAFLLGFFLASFFEIEKYLILILVAAGIIIFVINYRNKKIIVVSAAILFLALGIWRTNTSLYAAKSNLVDQKLGPRELIATVVKDPEVNEKYQKIVIQDEDKNKLLVNTDIYPGYAYGDELKVSCISEEPKNYEDSRFNYQMYLAKDGVYRICNKAKITLLLKNKGNTIFGAILSIRKSFEEKLSLIFPDPEGAYLKGLLLGGSGRMTKDLGDAFSRTGTTHTVAVSGFNVTVIAAFLMEAGILLGLWRQQVFLFALIGIILFVVMTGFPASAVRAGIMGSLVLWAMKEGRLANSANAILLAAVAMLMINPLLLRYDVGFQLSFLATLGIIWLYPLFEKKFKQSVAPKIIKETILLTLAATIFVIPIILYNFESLSLISLPANLLILPAIPYIMLGGFVAGMTGYVFLPLGKLIGFVAFTLLRAELFIVKGLSGLPWASIEIKNFGWAVMLGYYVILLGIIYAYKKSRNRMMPAGA